MLPLWQKLLVNKILSLLPQRRLDHENPSEILRWIRNLASGMDLSDDFWKYLVIQLLSPRFGEILPRYASKYSSDQIAHIGDILYFKPSAPTDMRPTVIDRISGRTFVIDSGCSISVIPPTANEITTLTPSRWLKMSQGKDIAGYGERELTVDFELGKFMPWNFFVVKCPEAIIGADFLTYYNLLVDTRRRKLIKNDPIPSLTYKLSIIQCFQPKSTEYVKSALCAYLEGHEAPSEILRLMQYLVPSEVLNFDTWKQYYLSLLPPSYRRILGPRRISCSIYELALEADEIYKRKHQDHNQILYITDRVSGMEFLVDSGAYLSQIPQNPNEKLEAIPIYRFIKANGFPVVEYGYKYLTVDLGMKETFSWNFLITNNNVPLIAADFLRYFDLCVDLRRRKLIKSHLTKRQNFAI